MVIFWGNQQASVGGCSRQIDNRCLLPKHMFFITQLLSQVRVQATDCCCFDLSLRGLCCGILYVRGGPYGLYGGQSSPGAVGRVGQLLLLLLLLATPLKESRAGIGRPTRHRRGCRRSAKTLSSRPERYKALLRARMKARSGRRPPEAWQAGRGASGCW